MRRTFGTRLALTALIALLLAAGISVLRERGNVDRVRTVASSRIDQTGQALLHLLTKGRALTYTANYDVQPGDPGQFEEIPTIVVMRKPPLVREDAVVASEGRRIESSDFVEADGDVVHCVREDKGSWSCRHVPAPVPDGPDSLLTQVRAAVTGTPVSQRSERIRGRDAQCFRIGGSRGDGMEVCLSAEGVPLLIASGKNTILLTALRWSVRDSDFAYPAPVGPAAG